jgi:hypothetical protein
LKHLEDLPQKFKVFDNQVDLVKTFIRQNV